VADRLAEQHDPGQHEDERRADGKEEWWQRWRFATQAASGADDEDHGDHGAGLRP
jgi:hypothetical protein